MTDHRRLGSLLDAAKITSAAALTLLPQQVDAPLTRAAVAVARRTARSSRTTRLANLMSRCLGDSPPGRTWHQVAEENMLVRAQGYWARARASHRRGWSAQLDIAGLDHIDAALRHGAGVILWRMNFCASHIPKQALHERGFGLVHVSRPEHGRLHADFLGRRVVAPLYRKAETRHLVERVEIDPDGSLDYLRSLVLRLRANGVVSIMGEFPGRAGHAAPVLETQLCFATGAPSLARASGAALLTLHARRLAYDHYRIVIEEPIALDGMGRSASLDAAVVEFAARLERAIRVHPEAWMGWERLR